MALHVNVVSDTQTYPLAAFELTALSSIRELAQTHLEKMGALTAAIDPGLLITDSMEMQYLALAYQLWNQLDSLAVGFGLEILPLGIYWPLVQESIQTSLGTYGEMLKALLTKNVMEVPLLGEFVFAPDYIPGTGKRPPDSALVQFGDVRTVLNSLGGGTGGEVPLSTGITGGNVFGEVLAANGIATNQMMWLYGETIRRSFNGHLQIDGLVFSDWNDEALQVSPQDRWIRSPRYRPGDHWGCACVVVPYIPNFDAPFPITIVPEPQVASARTTRFGFLPHDDHGPETEAEQFVVATLEEFYAPTQPRDRQGQWTTSGGSRRGVLSDSDWEAHKKANPYTDYTVIERAFGNGAEGIFGKSGALTTPTPWPSAKRWKDRPLYDRDAVNAAILNPPKLQPVDPRILRSTQPSITRHHLDYYMSDAWQRTGRTSADQSSAGNKFPVVWVTKTGEHVILSGHHRAAAALAKGEALPSIVVHEQ